MKKSMVKLSQEFNAPIDKVWEAFNDHENLGKIFGQKMTRIKDSTDAGNVNGTGSIRKIHLPLAPFEETIRKSVKPHCIEYQITKGTPLSHHYGTMHFRTLPDGGTALEYTIELGSRIPLLADILAAVLAKAIGGSIKKYADSLNK